MSNIEIVKKGNNLPAQQEQNNIIAEFEKKGITDEYIANKLFDIMENATRPNPKTGELVEDYETKLGAVKVYLKEKSNRPDVLIQSVNVFNSDKNIL